jgi:hypothetical protein
MAEADDARRSAGVELALAEERNGPSRRGWNYKPLRRRSG